MTVLLGKMARLAVALCLLVLGAYPVHGAEHLQVFTSAVPPIAQEDAARPGFAVELVQAVLHEATLDGEVVFVPWPRLLDSSGSRTGTLVLPVPRLAKVERDFTWITPLVDLDLSFVSTGQEVNSLTQVLELGSILVRGQAVYLPPRPTAASAAIRVAAVNNREFIHLQSAIKDFEASNPGVSVEISILQEGELRDAIAADVFSGSGRYDVIAIGTYETPIWAKKGWLRPIVEFPASYDVDNLMPSVKAALSYEDRLYALPFYAESSVTYLLWSWAFAIPSTSQKFSEALRFIQWATSKSYIQAIGERFGWVVAPPGTRQSTYRDPRYRASAPFADAVRDAIVQADPTRPTQHAVPYKGIQYVAIPEFQAVGTRVGQEMAKFLTGKTTLDDALFRANAATTEIMNAAGYYK